MDVPKQGPEGVEVLITDDGAWFAITTPRFWSKLPPKRGSFHVDRHGLIWMYQVCSKALRAPNVNEGFDELFHDLQASFDANGMETKVWDEALSAVADLMRKKGWVKV